MERHENSQRERVDIFLHIPKTAGSTLNRIVDRQYALDGICSIYPNNPFPGGIVRCGDNSLRELDEAQRAKIRLLRSHLSFGVHRFLPAPSVYFTILRDPVERMVSLYYFFLSLPQSSRPDYFPSGGISLIDCLREKISIEMDNAQTRMLAGDLQEVPFGRCTRDHLDRAQRNLRRHFVVAGLTERFDETLLLLRRALGWPNSIYYRRQNVTKKRPQADDLPPETLGAIVQANRLDIELYEYAKSMFETSIRRQGPIFALQLRAFRLLNRLQGQIGWS